MGMFDYVNFEMDCPVCGTKLDSFQSKDGSCSLEKIDPQYVFTMYDICPKCDSWVELRRPYEYVECREIPYTLDEAKELGFEIITK